MSRVLPRDLTIYDLLKTLAVVLMIIDHVGAYYFPDNPWLRVAGRLCVPVWFFLIGYARSRDTGWRLWVAALVVLASGMAAGLHVFPLNILFTILAVRLALDSYMRLAAQGVVVFWAGAVLLALLALPTGRILDYGTMGMVLAVFGWLCRRAEEGEALSARFLFPYMIFCIVVYVLMQQLVFGFTAGPLLALFAGTIAVFVGLSRFRPGTLPGLTAALPDAAVAMLRTAGRRTLAVYVGHLLALRLAGLVFFPEWFRFMGWHWTAYTGP